MITQIEALVSSEVETLPEDIRDIVPDLDPVAKLQWINAAKAKGEYVSGLQCGAFDVEDCGKLPGMNKMRTKLDWMAGLATFHPKSAARLRGLKNA